MSTETRRPLEENEIVIHVPKGSAASVKIQETGGDLPNEVTVQISKKRKPGVKPVLGVIVK